MAIDHPSLPSPELPRELFLKEYTCPLSGETFRSVAVKSNAYSVRSRGTDFAPHYQGVNPLHYAVIVSPIGFAADQGIYPRSPKLLFRDRVALVDSLTALGSNSAFCGVRDIAQACQSYELALSCTAFLRVPRHEIAALALRGSWLFMEWAEQGYEAAQKQVPVLRDIALQHYRESYEKEDVSSIKLGSSGVSYLIAELLRERGEFDESLRWFSRTIADKSAGAEVLRLARNQMDECREQRKQLLERGDYVKPDPGRALERVSYQIYRDQVQWLSKLAANGKLKESEVLRAILDGIRPSETTIAAFTSIEDLAQWLEAKLK